MSNFDEAREQSQALFNGQAENIADDPGEMSAEEVVTEGEGAEEVVDTPDTEGTEQQEEQVEESEMNTDIPSEPGQNPTVSERESQMLAEIQSLREQLQGANSTIQEMSRQREQEVVEEQTTPPSFENVDMSGLMFGDEESQKRAQTQFAENIGKYVLQMMDSRMKDMQPFIEEARRGQAERERRTAIDNLSADELTKGVSEVADRLDVIIKENPQMFPSTMSAEDKYTAAYTLMIGAQALMNPPKPPAEPTTDELMELYRNNPGFREAVERERIEAVKKNQQVPVFSPSNGVGNAAPTINEKPKTMADASSATRKMFQGL